MQIELEIYTIYKEEEEEKASFSSFGLTFFSFQKYP